MEAMTAMTHIRLQRPFPSEQNRQRFPGAYPMRDIKPLPNAVLSKAMNRRRFAFPKDSITFGEQFCEPAV